MNAGADAVSPCAFTAGFATQPEAAVKRFRGLARFPDRDGYRDRAVGTAKLDVTKLDTALAIGGDELMVLATLRINCAELAARVAGLDLNVAPLRRVRQRPD